MQKGSEHLRQVFSRLNKEYAIVIEPGACHGQQTKLISEFLDDGLYYAIEPDPRNVKILRRKRFKKWVSIIEGAISDHDGIVEFTTSLTNSAAGSCRKPTEKLQIHYPGFRFGSSIAVTCWTLDSFTELHCIPRIDFIHADIQGSERDLIEYGRDTLERTRLLNLEVSEGGGVYEGSWGMDKMINELGENWHFIGQFGPDILLENKKCR